MIAAAVFCPHPPVLVPEVAQGAAPELDDLRAACAAALAEAGAAHRRVVVLGAGPATREYGQGSRGGFTDFGVDLAVTLGGGSGPSEAGTAAATGRGTPADGPDGLDAPMPLSLAVGAWLLGRHDDVWAVAVEPDGVAEAAKRVAAAAEGRETVLLVMGDGSARRSPAAPGHEDPRAGDYDAAVAAALAAGDPAALAALDAGLGADLLAAGVPAWQAAAAALADRDWSARLHVDAAPYGVGYFVAAWS